MYKCASASKHWESLVWIVRFNMVWNTLSTPHQPLHILVLVLAKQSHSHCAAWMVVRVCVYCDNHFTLQCWNTPLFTPAAQRLQSMPSTKTHTYTHPLCPLTFDTHSLRTLPSNATGGVKSSFFSLQGKNWGQKGRANQRWPKHLGLQARYLKEDQRKMTFASLSYKAVIYTLGFFQHALCYITAVRCLIKILSGRKIRSLRRGFGARGRM